MGKKIREYVNCLHSGRDVKAVLPEYLRHSMHLYRDYAKVKMMMEYYLYYEMVSEGANPYLDTAQEETAELASILELLFSQEKAGGVQDIRERLLKMRGVVIDKMQVLTAYVDCFTIYEYLLNRIQYRFEEGEAMPEDIPFTRDVLQFIFGSGDNVAINDNIRFVVGQLPVRMARGHYFDLIKQSLSIYKGGEKSSLDSFLYMFRTSAMLYRTDSMKQYFTEFIPVLEEMSGMDFDGMAREAYTLCMEKLRVNVSKLRDISDLYLQVCKLINAAYTIAVADEVTAAGEAESGMGIQAEDLVLRGLTDLFRNAESAVWLPELRGASEEEKLYWLSEKLPEAEGRQEALYEEIAMSESVFDETVQVHRAVLEELGLFGQFRLLADLSRLNSGSEFVELGESQGKEIVTEQDFEETAAVLIGELKDLFRGSGKMLRRAIMANTLEKLPVFFQSQQEVADYISHSLAQCDDAAEKYAAKQLILEIMQG